MSATTGSPVRDRPVRGATRGGGIAKLLRVKRPGRLAAEAAALLIAVAVAFPLYWMVLSAFKPAGEIQSTDARPWTLAPSLDSF
ncbi:carbohydrate ABC transporter permease, partial [Streptomyces caelestis]